MSIFGPEHPEPVSARLSQRGQLKRPKTSIYTNRTAEVFNKTESKKFIFPKPMQIELPQRPKTAFVKFVPKKMFFDGTIGDFGKDAPAFTIGSSRKDPKPPPYYPGPGTYDVPSAPKSSQLKVSISRSEPYKETESPTINVDFTAPRVFPELRKMSISSMERQPFFELIKSPGPTYVPPSTLSKLGHKIANRPEDISESTPGPGEYTPKIISFEQPPAYSLSGPKDRDDWLKSTIFSPGPGQYQPDPLKLRQSVPVWSFGEKSRKQRRKNNIIVLGGFILKIDKSININDANRYIDKHPDLNVFLQEIYNHIIQIKPDNPVEILRAMFMDQKEERDKLFPKNQSDEVFELSFLN